MDVSGRSSTAPHEKRMSCHALAADELCPMTYVSGGEREMGWKGGGDDFLGFPESPLRETTQGTLHPTPT
jgi:hypothetical protein